MSASHRPIIIIKRPVQAAAHHGGGWKIAFADFMTAMMAFFLVMWLLSTSSPEQLAGIAGEFRMPLKVALAGGTKNNNNNSDSVIPGGGTDPTHAEGEVKMSSTDAESRDLQRQEDLKERLANMIEADPVLKLFRPQLLIDITPEGLRIQIVDSSNRPMFDRSSAIVMPYMRTILRAIGPVLNEQSNKITLSGHTDSTLYSQGDRSYSNWELSSDRANASRRELIAGGMLDTKVLRVMGVASSMPFSQEDPLAPVNRRISIVVLNKRAQAEIESANAVKAGLAVSPPGNAQQQPASAPAPAGVQAAAPDTGRRN
ncbi:flagellar motor protein MotB [Rhodoferax sp.]|uniref:flagellar motor protein MotB n=1 Tax=Rhodoferax sp. TaxID=50421 RepID=UPI00273138C9|nr:flagellar motor protein MotB [Rhodoferax sp.]MDP2442705.1 flagellar motor protein MotB [Rhodoferax sp.]MDP3865403.1 flagellar motor protein MotB [Rhodoferax sp.]MDZ4206351.1 flagellar motor protein MotB [Rhodoferax sp.]